VLISVVRLPANPSCIDNRALTSRERCELT
jgi:hypothetical protein